MALKMRMSGMSYESLLEKKNCSNSCVPAEDLCNDLGLVFPSTNFRGQNIFSTLRGTAFIRYDHLGIVVGRWDWRAIKVVRCAWFTHNSVERIVYPTVIHLL